MYRAPSPIFDVHDFPPLRRVKPLPKRRRTSDATHDATAATRPAPSALLDPSAAAEALMAQADALTAQMALSSYYMPVLEGVHDLLRKGLAAAASASASAPAPADLGAGAQDEDEDGGEGDYIDHLQQPGNTKKRKVPANMAGSAHGPDEAGSSGAEDELGERGAPAGARLDREYDAVSAPPPVPPGGTAGAGSGRISRATRAALLHKEMLRNRKRQLAAVLGALSHGDTLALDQALSASYPFASAGRGGDAKVRVRLSRRREARAARAYRAFRAAVPLPERAAHTVPSADFSLVCHSATSDRLIATKEEVAVLHARFEAELLRQAAEAAKQAEAAAAAALANGPHTKRTDRSKQGRSSDARGADTRDPAVDQNAAGNAKGRGKKKKRSALANASNPHHLRNYVPSRLPNSQSAATLAVANAQNNNLLSPFPLRFLSAEMPPRRRKASERTITPASTLANPADEWICPFCEYNLFYGSMAGYQHAVRNRKKILRRRRRARERAAAAASGVTAVKAAEKSAANEDVNAGLETAGGEVVPAVGKQAHKWKEEVGGGGPAAEAALG